MASDTPPHAALTRVRLDLAYDGTEFSGWATQPGLRTVQGELESALATLLRCDPSEARLTVGGRTDAGVHARGQVAHLDVTQAQLAKWNGRAGRDGVVQVANASAASNASAAAHGSARPDRPGGVEAAAVGATQVHVAGQGTAADGVADVDAADAAARVRKINGVLKRYAPDIAVHDVRIAPRGFDARFSAVRRRYEYRLRAEGAKRDPLTARFTAEVARELDLVSMQRASDELLGLNDFTTFCKAREGATAVRDLLCFEWRETRDGAYAARIEADAFCHSMVRALVGAVVAVGSGRISEPELVGLRDARERSSRFTVMPAHGLSLEEIAYPPDEELADRAAQTRARRDPLA